ncbi:magnesium transporter MgtE [Gemmatimonadetes bacterium T265]|nr:magnesium transporter MgtE [Gemmatimonadetes bacterium T265]
MLQMPAVAPADSAPELLYLVHRDPEELAAACNAMRPADIAESLRRLPADAGAKVLGALPFDLAVQTFDEPELADWRCELVHRLDTDTAATLVDAMSADQQADLFRELPDADRARLLPRVDAPTRAGLELLLRYQPGTAGGIMTTEFVALPAGLTAGAALDEVARVAPGKETVYVAYVTDAAPGQDAAQGRLVRAVSLRDLLVAPREQPVAEVGVPRPPITVRAETPRAAVARTVGKYNLLAVPVVDDAGRVLGIVTVDDVIDAIVREQTEDIQKLGGNEAFDVPYTRIGFWQMVRKRAGWLCALFLSEMLTATAMQRFEGTIEKAVVLSMFIPLVMSSGGNSGSQATSLIIRALALRELSLGDWWRTARRELPTGLVLGSILGVIGFARIELWQHLGLYDYGVHHWLVALTVGTALIGIVAFGSLAGSMLPFVLKRLGFDPASASAPFVATLVDVTGLIIYFSVAVVILRGTLL